MYHRLQPACTQDQPNSVSVKAQGWQTEGGKSWICSIRADQPIPLAVEGLVAESVRSAAWRLGVLAASASATATASASAIAIATTSVIAAIVAVIIVSDYQNGAGG